MIQLSLNLDQPPVPSAPCTVCHGSGEFLEDGRMVYCLCEAGEELDRIENPDSMMRVYEAKWGR